jgi:hypothetical protein
MPRGGARPNSGPKKNPLVKTTREAMLEATKAVDLTPARVFAENLRFWYDAATALTNKIVAILELPAERFADEPELLKDLNTNIKNMLIARDKAQECAVDMAPYRHPRLSQIEVAWPADPTEEDKLPKITHQLDPRAAALAYEQSLKGRL